ncbi:hypothetical protein BDV24DRAFT_127221 [Aspergillus arachidicola]|uniref:Uncharacterized protein n=1 Tax=Aspergillus arachidicola TaxID=656916 RepID=A0A5N6YG28_9EURO|nr:hypothetical protein BDV24DRAFT_127221 [Aspergillus arachidicola]
MNSEFSTKQPLSNLSRNSGWTFLLWSVLYNVLGVFVRKGECFRLRFRGRVPSEDHPRRSCSGDNGKGRWVLGPHGRSLSTRDSYCHVWSCGVVCLLLHVSQVYLEYVRNGQRYRESTFI